MKTLVLANQKGGVGKSAVATLIAQHLVRQGKRVLAIDFDHQGNFTDPLLLSKKAQAASYSSEQFLSEAIDALPRLPFVVLPASDGLLGLERRPTEHNAFLNRFNQRLKALGDQFDVCVVDTHPNPDIRLICALACCDFVLSPIQLNQEAVEGVDALLNHPRTGVRKIKYVLNKKLQLIGLLPTMVERTPFQRENLIEVGRRHMSLMIRLPLGGYAQIPRRSAIAEAQAEGLLLWEMQKTAARDTWKDIEPTIARIADIVTCAEPAGVAAA